MTRVEEGAGGAAGGGEAGGGGDRSVEGDKGEGTWREGPSMEGDRWRRSRICLEHVICFEHVPRGLRV